MPFAKPHKTLIANPQIESRIRALAAEIDAAYAQAAPVVLLCVLTGARPFFEALSAALTIPHTRASVQVSSYGAVGARLSTGDVRIVQPIDVPLHHAHVIVVEDIIDTGYSMRTVLELVDAQRPASVAVCTLLSKPSRRVIDVPLEYVGFSIDDHFVFGYGIDVDQQYRELNYIGYFE
ncbi:MAG: hypoxanthine phosphoribosyltransferase [bacterium]|nr:hypoxanthine phosphoribosyltransferase [bacterium]